MFFLLAWSWDAQLTRWIVWGGLIALTLALLLLIRTRWGQSQPLGKCVVLSLLAHLLLGIYLTTINIVTATVGSPDGDLDGIEVALVDGSPLARTSDTPFDVISRGLGVGENFTSPGTALAANKLNDVSNLPEIPVAALPLAGEPVRNPVSVAMSAPSPTVKSPVVEEAAAPFSAAAVDEVARPVAPTSAEPIELPNSAEGESLDLVPPPEQPTRPQVESKNGAARDAPDGSEGPSTAKPAEPTTNSDSKTTVRSTDSATQPAALAEGPAGGKPMAKVPSVMSQRVGDHVAKGHGATEKTEAAVKNALAWLAASQRPSGRWDARELGAGAARAADGEDRLGAGQQADSGITGLALLAFLAGGHTHLRGTHQAAVRRGLEYLLSVQDSSGCLAGNANRYERMYCHAMATCALSEAFAMTGDRRLEAAVRNAIGYTLRAQDRVSGGWRYQPSDPGDTSQLGWQLMALKSAELGGIPIPPEARDGIARFLRSVSAGRNGGLAFYQPSRPIASRSMTAEALACRRFLGLADSAPSLDESSTFLLQELPGAGTTNHYYWYYATLALYQTQGEAWRRWNEALQTTLLAAQRRDGSLSGSWDPDPVWGGCGGRAYSTALATLCLEVYYRFLPLYVEAAGRERRAK